MDIDNFNWIAVNRKYLDRFESLVNEWVDLPDEKKIEIVSKILGGELPAQKRCPRSSGRYPWNQEKENQL